MSTLTRTVLAWLLMLAIPLQGIAATAMLFCAPGHHGAAVPPVAVHAAGHADGPFAQQAGQHPAGTMAQAQDHHAHQHGTTSPTGHTGHTADAKCSACAACCTGSALVSTRSSEPAAVAGSAPIPFTLAPFASHIPLGADPPPRSRLA